MQNKSSPSPHDEVKKARKEIVRSIVFSFAALAVLIFACVAWFTSNTKVMSTMGYISAAGSTFELASVGTVGVYDGKIPDDLYTEGIAWNASVGQGTRTETNSVILWQLTEDSNIGNNASTGDSNSGSSGGNGILPGSSGQLQFYVIPKVDGELKLKFHLNIIPLKDDGNDNVTQYPETDDKIFGKLSKLLNGHIMFFLQTGEENIKKDLETWIRCNTGEFSMTFSGKAGEPQLVTLQWEWPYQWENIDKNIQEEMWKDAEMKEYIFESENEESSNAKNLSFQYDQANIFIGDNATWLLVQLLAQPE